MKLDPVYLLAPKPKPPSMPTRRAFLIAGSTFLAGAGLGSACGYAVGSRPAEAAVDAVDPKQEWLKPTGDAQLDELRRLALKAPIEELMPRAPVFLDLMRESYPADEALWKGTNRICDELLSNERINNRRPLARWLTQLAQGADPKLSAHVRARAPELMQLR